MEIIWSNRAKKRLYGILESCIGRDNNKSRAIELQKLIFRSVKQLAKNPGTGLKTTDPAVLALSAGPHTVLYEKSDNKVIIHTIVERQ